MQSSSSLSSLSRLTHTQIRLDQHCQALQNEIQKDRAKLDSLYAQAQDHQNSWKARLAQILLSTKKAKQALVNAENKSSLRGEYQSLSREANLLKEQLTGKREEQEKRQSLKAEFQQQCDRRLMPLRDEVRNESQELSQLQQTRSSLSMSAMRLKQAQNQLQIRLRLFQSQLSHVLNQARVEHASAANRKQMISHSVSAQEQLQQTHQRSQRKLNEKISLKKSQLQQLRQNELMLSQRIKAIELQDQQLQDVFIKSSNQLIKKRELLTVKQGLQKNLEQQRLKAKQMGLQSAQLEGRSNQLKGLLSSQCSQEQGRREQLNSLQEQHNRKLQSLKQSLKVVVQESQSLDQQVKDKERQLKQLNNQQSLSQQKLNEKQSREREESEQREREMREFNRKITEEQDKIKAKEQQLSRLQQQIRTAKMTFKRFEKDILNHESQINYFKEKLDLTNSQLQTSALKYKQINTELLSLHRTYVDGIFEKAFGHLPGQDQSQKSIEELVKQIVGKIESKVSKD